MERARTDSGSLDALNTDLGFETTPATATLNAAGAVAVDRVLGDDHQYHVVAKGESLSSIAEKVLHDRAAWLTLWQINQKLVPQADKLRIGTKLMLPTPAELVAAGRPTNGAPSAGVTKPTAGGNKADAADDGADSGGSDPTSQARALFERHGDLIRSRSAQIGIEPAIAAAIVLVESSGSGIRDGRTVIRFEPKIFRQFTKHVVSDTHKSQAVEYAALARAVKINEDAAYRSISMGAGQIMGFNATSLNYASAKAMLTAFGNDEAEQISAMLQFIQNNVHLVNAARDQKWTAFARIYNGPKQRGYDKKLARAYTAAKSAEASTENAEVDSSPDTEVASTPDATSTNA